MIVVTFKIWNRFSMFKSPIECNVSLHGISFVNGIYENVHYVCRREDWRIIVRTTYSYCIEVFLYVVTIFPSSDLYHNKVTINKKTITSSSGQLLSNGCANSCRKIVVSFSWRPIFNCSKLIMETIEQGVKYVQS